MATEEQKRFVRRLQQVLAAYLAGEYAHLAAAFHAHLAEARATHPDDPPVAMGAAIQRLKLEEPTLFRAWVEITAKAWATASLQEGGTPTLE